MSERTRGAGILHGMAKQLRCSKDNNEDLMIYTKTDPRLAYENHYSWNVLASAFLVAAAALTTAAIVTNNWLAGRLNLPTNTTNIPISIDIDVKVGLKETCFLIVHRTAITTSMKMGVCVSADNLEAHERSIAEASMKDFAHIFVCMCTSLATCVLALAASCLSMTRWSSGVQRKLLLAAAFLSLLTVTSNVTAVAIAQYKLHGEAEFMRAGLTEDVAYEETLGTDTTAAPSRTQNEVDAFSNLSAVLARSGHLFAKGYSFMLACGGGGAGIIALVVLFREIIVNRRRIKDQHSKTLLVENVVLNAKGNATS